jgi:hypothetical protein
MQRRVVQEMMQCRNSSRLRQVFQNVWDKAQRYEHIGQDAAKDGEPSFVPRALGV